MPRKETYKHNLCGIRFGRLIAISISGYRNGAMWLCKCDCGKYKIIKATSLIRNISQSCGCLQKERAGNYQFKHGQCRRHSVSGSYKSWNGMISRCENKDNPRYPDYGGRGIKVHQDFNTFEKFYEYMGDRPRGASLGRINNNKGYSPDNCRWETSKQQARNKRNNHLIYFMGETHCASEWCEITGIPWKVLKGRLRHKWTIERALTTPIRVNINGHYVSRF